MKTEVSKQPLTSIWHFIPTLVTGGGAGWAGGQPEAQEQLGRGGGSGSKAKEKGASHCWEGVGTRLSATEMALYMGGRASGPSPHRS